MPSVDWLTRAEETYCSQGDTAAKRSKKIIIHRSKGCFVESIEGISYLDMQMFNGAANFGYANPDHTRAICSKIESFPGVGSEFQNPDRITLSSQICQSIKERFGLKGRVHFSVGGAQAIEDAMKIVMTSTGRRLVFAYEGGYHGRTIAASAISSSYRYRRRFTSEGRAHFLPYPYCFRCPYDKHPETCNYYCVAQVERLFQNEFHGFVDPESEQCEYGAVVVEPVLGRGGYVVPPKDYFRKLKTVLEKHKILLIADEIQMGFYRTGKLWSIENFGVAPDILVFGKAASNGVVPLSGLWAREELIDPKRWTPSSSHATFAGNPVSMAAGIATFNLIEQPALRKRIARLSEMFSQYFKRLQKNRPYIARVDCLGLALGVELCLPGSTKPFPELANTIRETALTQPVPNLEPGKMVGMILTVGGYYNNVLMLSPSLLMSDDEFTLFSKLFEHYINLAMDTITPGAH